MSGVEAAKAKPPGAQSKSNKSAQPATPATAAKAAKAAAPKPPQIVIHTPSQTITLRLDGSRPAEDVKNELLEMLTKEGIVAKQT